MSIVIMNHVLKKLLTWLQKFERPESVTRAERDLSVKLFLTEFVNTALVVALAAGFKELREEGFSFAVYGTVGQDVIYAVIYAAIFPRLYPLLDYLILAKWRRHRRRQRCATQGETNKIYQGPVFSLGNRYPDILLVLFLSLTYSGPMPILLPCAAVAFWLLYYVDWFLLLRYYTKPPMYDEQLATNFSGWLPFALLIHYASSIMAFGNRNVLPIENPPVWLPMSWLLHSSVIPSVYLETYMVLMVPIVLLGKYSTALHWLPCLQRNEKQKSPIFSGQRVFPSYTGVYFQVVDPNRKLTDLQWELEKELGISQIEGGVTYRMWRTHGTHHGGVAHRAGQKKSTWECINDYSYRITALPKYQRSVALLANYLNRSLAEAFLQKMEEGKSCLQGFEGDSPTAAAAAAAAANSGHQQISTQGGQGQASGNSKNEQHGSLRGLSTAAGTPPASQNEAIYDIRVKATSQAQASSEKASARPCSKVVPTDGTAVLAATCPERGRSSRACTAPDGGNNEGTSGGITPEGSPSRSQGQSAERDHRRSNSGSHSRSNSRNNSRSNSPSPRKSHSSARGGKRSFSQHRRSTTTTGKTTPRTPRSPGSIASPQTMGSPRVVLPPLDRTR
ncbi:unnamed protein product [Chrysoparadoxa australica]